MKSFTRRNFLKTTAAGDYFNPGQTLFRQNEPFNPPKDDFYMTDFFSDAAVDYTDTYGQREEPFFMYLAYTAPHWPIQAPEEEIEKYLTTYMQGWDKLREQREGYSHFFWEHEGNRAVRQGKWKLVSSSYVGWKFHSRFSFTNSQDPNTTDWELYDMDADRTEMNNLADQYPEKVEELATRYEEWAEQNKVLPWKEYMARTNIPWLESLENINPPSKK